jgi:hypothetical protein
VPVVSTPAPQANGPGAVHVVALDEQIIDLNHHQVRSLPDRPRIVAA